MSEIKQELAAPWRGQYGKIPATLTYPEATMYELMVKSKEATPDAIALEFMGKNTTYREFVHQVEQTANAFLAMGVKENDRVTISMPNTPQAIAAFYALNRIGAIANMIHPLSAPGEILFAMNLAKSSVILTLDKFVPNVTEIIAQLDRPAKVIVARISDALPQPKKILFAMLKERKQTPVPKSPQYIMWNDFIARGASHPATPPSKKDYREEAVILYSGGTTGTNKGIRLSSANFNATAFQTVAASGYHVYKFKLLAVMPIFHGFGLGVSIHTALINSCTAILMPQFNLKTYATNLRDKKPDIIAGVPTLYQALLKAEDLKNADLSFLKGMFSGGDTLSIELKRKVDAFLRERGAKIQVREGYGSTETVTATCLTPPDQYREGSIGIPYPDMYFKVVKPGTTDELPLGEDGEICVTGPSLMLGYLDNPEETADAIKVHADGHSWLHSGDLGKIDEDGFIYFLQRIKRMIVASGYNIYPSQIENIIEQCPKVMQSCVIGVPDEYRMRKIKAFVALRPEFKGQEEAAKTEIMALCTKNIAKYAMPAEIEFRDELPKTLVGKVAYRVLEEEEAVKRGEVPPSAQDE
ncbi:MAG: acyl--CoA ligase [Oscillospiraceae bacterium]|nr:acyl--CoA ligase [Oscillospiraceae bacterium]